MRNFITLIFLITSTSVYAVDFKPYAGAKVSAKQWEAYHQIVLDSFESTAQKFPKQHLVVYFNDPEATSYAFTTKGHEAHPSWITRKAVELKGSVNMNQIGYFAGQEKAFAKLYKQYIKLNDKLKADMSTNER
jgi:hypothetical protein